MFKLVAVDLDGTLLNSKKAISEENKRIIQAAISKGIRIVVCSGRIYAGARIFARQLETQEPIIACNGAIIRDSDTGELLYSNSLQDEDSLKVIDICHKEDVYFHFYIGDTMYTERLGYSSLSYWKKNQELPEVDRVDIRLVESLGEVIGKIDIPASKVVIISDDPDHLSRIRHEVLKIKTVDAMSSSSNNFEVVNKGVNKGKALKFLADRFHIKTEEIIAIGDNENDITMIEYAGLGVAMGNAEQRIKEIADFITLSNDENGVAEIIRRFIL